MSHRDPPRHRGLSSRLDARFAAALCLGAAVILAVAGSFNIALQREHMTRLIGMTATGTADTILRSTREAMLDDSPEDVNRILATIGAQEGYERIRIFDKQGRIQKSTLAEDVGQLVDKQAEQCFVCHSADRPLERLEGVDRVRIFERGEGRSILGVIAPIRNEPDCSSAACHAHPASQQVLGVLDVQLSLGPVEDLLVASEHQLGLGLLVTVLAVLLLTGYLTWRMVLLPVRRLTRATRRVAAGDLTTRAPVQSSDEIGDMTAAWNTMVSELSRTRDELERWSHTLEERVEEKTEELKAAHQRMLVVEKMASLGKLAAVVAHEINNPLAGIATYARLLKRRLAPEGEGSGETAKVLDLVEREAARCGDIVRNLLLFSRVPGARFTDEQLPPLFERCVLLVRHQAELQEVEIACEFERDLPAITCDASQVQQLVLALCMNAIEAMPSGGRLVLRARTRGEGVELEVEDSGCGIEPKDLEHIFEPFFTTKEQGKGVGLGLAVVYGIVERHHGRIDVRSKPGVGTTFTVRLPRRQPSEPAAPAEALEGVVP
jgi:two-component system NtrC family sensor kinase